MYGFDAISANNGWAMAIAGALIVLTGLAVLSFVISQLHRAVALLEKKEKKSAEKPTVAKSAPAPIRTVLDIETSREQYRALTEELDEPFALNLLYDLAQADDLPHVHLTIRTLREAGVLVSVGDGKFKWQA